MAVLALIKAFALFFGIKTTIEMEKHYILNVLTKNNLMSFSIISFGQNFIN